MNGQCLCGAVRITLRGRPTTMEACHCASCRKVTGGGPGLGAPVRGEDLTIEGAEHITRYPSSEHAERAFCRVCGSNLFFRLAGDAATGNLSLCPGLLDDMNGVALVEEMFIDAKPDGYALAGEHRRITGAEALQGLSAFLARRRDP